jgi:hypothetical protein
MGGGAPSADSAPAPRPTSEKGRQADHGLLKDEDRARQVLSGLAVLATVHRPVDQACFDVAGPIVGALS